MVNTIVFQRHLWTCIYLSFITYTIFMVVSLWNAFLTNPTITTMVSSTYPVNQIPFPGIAVCSINKISKKRAQILALHIANLTSRDPKEIMTFMKFVGHLYNFEFEISSLSNLLEFQKILDMLEINVIDLVRKLSTPCEELLRSCFWQNVEVNCSNFFFTRRTHRGYCCVFNYIKITRDGSQRIKDTPLSTDAGVQNGLYVSVNNDPKDYYYTMLSCTGVMLHIFLPTSYPDKSSGGLTEIFTQPNSENFVEITPTTLTTVEEVANFPVEKRQCVFNHERKTAFHGTYSQSDCFVDCRVHSMQAMCQCTPFMIPISNKGTVCNLADLPCLSRYKGKWDSHFPDEDVGLHLEKEKQDSLHCDKKCYPPCTETVYKAFANSFPIFNKTERRENITRIYIYYGNRFSRMYRQDVVYHWFEILSNFGGTFGIFIGWSFISIIQLLHHYVKIIVERLQHA